MSEGRKKQPLIGPLWLIAAGVTYFFALLLSKNGTQLALLALLALAGILLLRQSIGSVSGKLGAMWAILGLAGLIHFAFRWWLAPSHALQNDAALWLAESAFFSARLALFLVCGIVLGMACAAEHYVAAMSAALGRLTSSNLGAHTAVVLTCALTIVPSVRLHIRSREVARLARRVVPAHGILSHLHRIRSDFFSMLNSAMRHADALALSIWTRQIELSAVVGCPRQTRVFPVVVCGAYCLLCLSILPL